VLLDDVSGLLTVRVQGFDAPFAQQLNRAILEESEAFVNKLSQRMAQEQLQFAETELGNAAEKLQAAKSKMMAFQATHKVLDASAQAQASGALTSELQAQLSKHEAELKNLLTYLNEDAYQVQALRNQVKAMRSQLDVELSRATAPKDGRRLNALAAEFQDLRLQAGFAEDVYKLALTAVESGRIEATRKLKSLAVIEPPTRPETAEYPRRLYNLITLMVLSALLYGIVRLILATIAEHQD
jgi:capsular polysaccharide transport system permease protein